MPKYRVWVAEEWHVPYDVVAPTQDIAVEMVRNGDEEANDEESLFMGRLDTYQHWYTEEI